VERQRRPGDVETLSTEPALEAGVFRETCLVLCNFLNIARLRRRFFHAAAQREPEVSAAMILFSNQSFNHQHRGPRPYAGDGADKAIAAMLPWKAEAD
jgi:hypothetical protein